MKPNIALSKREVGYLRRALCLAIDTEEASIDAHTPTYGRRQRWMTKARNDCKKNVRLFTRLLDKIKV